MTLPERLQDVALAERLLREAKEWEGVTLATLGHSECVRLQALLAEAAAALRDGQQPAPQAVAWDDRVPSYAALEIIAHSVCSALTRAGFDSVDDPGEAIDVMREGYERELAKLRQHPTPPTDGDMARALDWVRALAAPCSAEEREALSAIEEAIAAYPANAGGRTVAGQQTAGRDGCGMCGGFCNHPQEHSPQPAPQADGDDDPILTLANSLIPIADTLDDEKSVNTLMMARGHLIASRYLARQPQREGVDAAARKVIENINNATAIMRDKGASHFPDRYWLTEQVNILRAALATAAQQPAVDDAGVREWGDRHEAALDHIARVALGSRSRTNRMLWIAQRAKSALNGDEVWKQAQQPRGYHEALERTAMQAGGEVEGG